MKKFQIKLGRFIGVAFGAVALQACALASVGTEAPNDIYVLTAPTIEFGESKPPLSTQIVVEVLEAHAALRSSLIVYQPSPTEIRYFSGARWADQVPDMVLALLVDAIDQSGRFQAVGSRSAGIHSDYLLKISISRFGVESDGSEMDDVRVEVSTKIVRRFSDTVIATRRFASTRDAESGSISDVVNAFDQANSEVLSAVAIWAYDEVVAAESAKLAS